LRHRGAVFWAVGDRRLDGLAGGFNASSSNVRTPVWITDSNLGVFRSNNYITIPMALYDPANVEFVLLTLVNYLQVYTLMLTLAIYTELFHINQALVRPIHLL
jgi:hypothetical protein